MKSAIFILLLAIVSVKVNLQCLTGWHAFQDSCYLFVQENYTWFDAKRSCDEAGSVLVEIGSDDENDFLSKMMDPGNESMSWVGIEDMFMEGTWVLASNQQPVTYSNWMDGEPNDFRGIEDCAVLSVHYGGKWLDVPCEYVKAVFFCETRSL